MLGSGGIASCPGYFTSRERAPGTYWIKGWVDPRASLEHPASYPMDTGGSFPGILNPALIALMLCYF